MLNELHLKTLHFWETKIAFKSHLCYKSIINYDLNVTNILVISPQICYIVVFHIAKPPINEQIWLVPSDIVKIQVPLLHSAANKLDLLCVIILKMFVMLNNYYHCVIIT